MNIQYEELKKLVEESISISEIQRKLGYNSKGGNVSKNIKEKIEHYQIDISHFKGKAHGTSVNGKDLSTILIKNSTYVNNTSLKNRLLKEKILEYKCNICGIYEWNNKKLSLQLDHINGINNDNTVTNLRLLCPNCHSQTSTFAGRNIKKNKYKGL